MHDVAGTVTTHEPPAGTDVTVYELGVPPLLGGVIVTVADPVPTTAVGGPGTPGAASTTADDALDALDVAVAFVAVEVNV